MLGFAAHCFSTSGIADWKAILPIVRPMPISLKHQQVCDLILAGEPDAQAYARVYGKSNADAARASVSKMLRRPDVVEYMAQARGQVTAAVVAAAVKSATDVLADIEAIADADSRELMEYRRGCCRHCWGREFLYQRTPQELRDHIKKHNEANEKRLKDSLPAEPLDEGGGIGYNRTRQANPDCPECFGEGEGYEFFKDTRTVSEAAAKLFAGVKVKNNGLEFVTHSQQHARDMLARHHGLLDKKGDAGDTPATLAAAVRELLGAAGAIEGASDGNA